MTTEVVVLGGGFGGLELSSRLAEAVGDRVRITLIDQSDAFVFGFAKLDVLFGRRELGEVRHPYERLSGTGVEFRRERITAIDPENRRVTTDAGTYEPDILVVALGADLDPGATPGFAEVGTEFYSPAGAESLGERVRSFRSGVAVVSVFGPFFKCPPAPYECAFMLHDQLTAGGVRDACEIWVTTPLPMAIPISRPVSAEIASEMERRDIRYRPSTRVARVDGATSTLHFDEGPALAFDLLMGVPVHRAPAVVVESGLTEDGWVPVDPATFATRHPGVYAVGDVTSAPVPRAGVIAEGEAATLADVLIAQLTGSQPPPPYDPRIMCYIEMGDPGVAVVDVNFPIGGAPSAAYRPPSPAGREAKGEFAASRLARWFGPGPRAAGAPT